MKKERRTTTSCVTKRASFMIADTGGLEAHEGIASGVDLVLMVCVGTIFDAWSTCGGKNE